MDVTDRKRSELAVEDLNNTLERRVKQRTRELLHSEARFDAYFEASPEYLFLVRVTPDDQLVFEEINAAAEALYGMPRSQFIGRTLAEVLPPARVASVEGYARECLRLGRPLRYEAETPVASVRVGVRFATGALAHAGRRGVLPPLG